MRHSILGLALLAGFATLPAGCTQASSDVKGAQMLDVSDVFGPEDQSDRLDDRFSDAQTSIFLSHAQNGHLDAMREMVARGYDISTKGQAGVTPAFAYVAYVRPVRADALTVMIELGADVTAPLDNNMSLLNALARGQDARVAETLLQAGVSPDTTLPATGSTFLMTAIAENNTALVAKLVASGANVDLASASGQRPVALARDSGYFEALMVLIEAGADPRADDPDLSRARAVHDRSRAALVAGSANEQAHHAFGEWLKKQS